MLILPDFSYSSSNQFLRATSKKPAQQAPMFLGHNYDHCEEPSEATGLDCYSDGAILSLTPEDKEHPARIVCDDCGAIRELLTPLNLITMLAGA